MNSVFPVFMGCGRSGTTLIRSVFDAHPDLAVTHEAHFVAPMARNRHKYMSSGGFDSDVFIRDLFDSPNFRRQAITKAAVRERLNVVRPAIVADAVRVVFGLYAEERGKTLYGDKTPGYVNHVGSIAGMLPETRFVHMIRDGRAVALSYLDRPEWGPDTLGAAAYHWRSRVHHGRSAGELLGPGRYMELKYEELVSRPELTVRRVCDFLGLSFAPVMLNYHRNTPEFIASTKDPAAFENLARPISAEIRDWKSQMTARDIAFFETIAGNLLSELRYETSQMRFSARTMARAVAAGARWHARRLRSRVPNLTRSVAT